MMYDKKLSDQLRQLIKVHEECRETTDRISNSSEMRKFKLLLHPDKISSRLGEIKEYVKKRYNDACVALNDHSTAIDENRNIEQELKAWQINYEEVQTGWRKEGWARKDIESFEAEFLIGKPEIREVFPIGFNDDKFKKFVNNAESLFAKAEELTVCEIEDIAKFELTKMWELGEL